MEHNYSYTDAFNDLQILVAEIENGEANVDELAAKIKRSAELIAICKAKLTSTEDKVNSLINQLMEETSADADKEDGTINEEE